MSDTSNTEHDPSVEGERGHGITSVAEESNRGQSLGKMLAVAAISIAGLGFLYLTWDRGSNGDDRQQPSRTTIAPAVPFTPVVTPPDPAPQETVQLPQPVPAAQPEPEPVDEMLEASMRAPVIAFSSDVQRGAGQGQGQMAGLPSDFSLDLPPGLGGALGMGGQQQQQADRLRDRLQPTQLEGVRASVLPDLHMVVPQGTSIPCILQTAVSTDQPGMVSCTIQRDVLSASGQVVLMEKGTVVVGEYDAGLRRGQQRIFVLWNRARTPTGVIVDLASPAADGLGRTGFSGNIDTHFWERFGGALLMSIVGDASSYAFRQFGGQSDVDLRETERATRDAASIALENSINIPPTLYKNQGELVSIFVARDLDFSGVYDLRVTETREQIYDRSVFGNMHPFPAKPVK